MIAIQRNSSINEDRIIRFKSPLVTIVTTDRIVPKVTILIQIFRRIELTVVIALVRRVVKASIALREDSILRERKLWRVPVPVACIEFLILSDCFGERIVSREVKECTKQAQRALIEIVFKKQFQIEDLLEVAQACAISDEGFRLGCNSVGLYSISSLSLSRSHIHGKRPVQGSVLEASEFKLKDKLHDGQLDGTFRLDRALDE